MLLQMYDLLGLVWSLYMYDLFLIDVRPNDARFILSDRYKRGSFSMRRKVISKPKHVAGPTPLKVQFIKTLITVS